MSIYLISCRYATYRTLDTCLTQPRYMYDYILWEVICNDSSFRGDHTSGSTPSLGIRFFYRPSSKILRQVSIEIFPIGLWTLVLLLKNKIRENKLYVYNIKIKNSLPLSNYPFFLFSFLISEFNIDEKLIKRSSGSFLGPRPKPESYECTCDLVIFSGGRLNFFFFFQEVWQSYGEWLIRCCRKRTVELRFVIELLASEGILLVGGRTGIRNT